MILYNDRFLKLNLHIIESNNKLYWKKFFLILILKKIVRSIDVSLYFYYKI